MKKLIAFTLLAVLASCSSSTDGGPNNSGNNNDPAWKGDWWAGANGKTTIHLKLTASAGTLTWHNFDFAHEDSVTVQSVSFSSTATHIHSVFPGTIFKADGTHSTDASKPESFSLDLANGQLTGYDTTTILGRFANPIKLVR